MTGADNRKDGDVNEGMKTIGFIGAGKMAEAMMAGLIAKQVFRPGEIVAADISADRLAELGGRMGIRTVRDNAEVARQAMTCVLAVKPQQLDDVLRRLAPEITREHLLISIAAGKTTASLEALLPAGRLVRVMPNIACLAGEGMNVFTCGSRATTADANDVRTLLGCCGKVMELAEDQFDAVTALSGSGPAFFAWFLDRLVDGAVAAGLTRRQALFLAEQTMAGTARLLMEKQMEPADLAAAVTSPGGTTAAGRAVLEQVDLADRLNNVIRAAALRSRELGHA